MDILILRLDAPLMSFGGPIVDNFGVIQELPALSMLTGLVGNALGLEHGHSQALNRLQDRLRYAVCRERLGEKIRDFQTVDLTQGTDTLKAAKLVGWTTRGYVEERGGSADTLREKHIRFRDYWADAVFRVALLLEPAQESPTLDDIASALREPERPLFIGRKPCLPSAPLLESRVQASSLVAALKELAPDSRSDGAEVMVWWEDDVEAVASSSFVFAVSDEREWRSQLHGGQRFLRSSILRRTGDEP